VALRRVLRVSAVVGAALVGLLAAGCAQGGGSVAAAAVEKPDLTIAAVPAVDSVGLYVAQQRGLFAAQGLHVKIVPATSSSTAIADQVAGKYDVTDGNYVSYILAEAQQRAKLLIIAEGSVMQPRTQEVLVSAGSPIKSIADLNGKSIGVNVPDNIGTLLVSSVLASNGMTRSQVRFVPVPFPLMSAALKAHKVDAAWLPEPFITGAQTGIGAEELFDADQGGTQNLPIAGYVVTDAWAKRYPRTAAAFRRAIEQAQAIADTNRTAVEQAISAFTGVPRLTATLIAADSYPLRVDPVRIQRVADLMQRFGLLQHPFNITPMISGG
jgi:NitT/TauT family transport system substrate-binding protein